MKRQVFNPYLPLWEYIPDGEPRVFDGRLYIFGSHDKAGGKSFCLNDYVAWSCPEDDLSDWRYEGVIFRKNQTPWNTKNEVYYAPDVVRGLDGKYYLYYFVANSSILSVAVCDTPAGKYEYLGDVHLKDGRVYGTSPEDWFTFDPGVLVDDDGRIWLYTGSGQPSNGRFGHEVKGCFVMELDQDMLTVISEPKIVLPADWDMKRPSFFEGPSPRHIGDLYYLIYPTSDQTGLNYATAKSPTGPFSHQGPIHSTSEIGYHGTTMRNAVYPIGNNHGSLVCVKGQWYIFDHRMTNGSMYSRQGVAEPVTIQEDGSIEMVEVTSCGLNGKPLEGIGTYPAGICCILYRDWLLRNPAAGNPMVTQSGEDYVPAEPSSVNHEINVDTEENAPDSFVKNIKNNSVIGYRYFDLSATKEISLELRGRGKGTFEVSVSENGDPVAEVPFDSSKNWSWSSASLNLKNLTGLLDLCRLPIFLRYKGKGAPQLKSIDLR
ncbi:MAG: family 43 glycosylhydrolase [Oscillospiraceae bacterium]|nr:family 43 glycosylhydrolase [Oscillospiraceae bacterium]